MIIEKQSEHWSHTGDQTDRFGNNVHWVVRKRNACRGIEDEHMEKKEKEMVDRGSKLTWRRMRGREDVW